MTSNSIFDKNMETVSTKEGEELTQGLQETPGDYSERPLAPPPFKHSTSLSSFAWGTRECTGLSGPRDFLFTEALWFRKATGCSTTEELSVPKPISSLGTTGQVFSSPCGVSLSRENSFLLQWLKNKALDLALDLIFGEKLGFQKKNNTFYESRIVWLQFSLDFINPFKRATAGTGCFIVPAQKYLISKLFQIHFPLPHLLKTQTLNGTSQIISKCTSFPEIQAFHNPPCYHMQSPSPRIWQFNNAGGGRYITPVTSITLIAASCPVLT